MTILDMTLSDMTSDAAFTISAIMRVTAIIGPVMTTGMAGA